MCSTHARWGAVLQHAALLPAPGCFRALGPAGSSGMGRAGSRPACLGAVLLLWSCESSQAAAQCALRSNAWQERATETDLYFSGLRRRKKVSLDESAASNSREGNFFCHSHTAPCVGPELVMYSSLKGCVPCHPVFTTALAAVTSGSPS